MGGWNNMKRGHEVAGGFIVSSSELAAGGRTKKDERFIILIS
jgi:hypothetical protein